VAQFGVFILVIPTIRRSSAGRGIWRRQQTPYSDPRKVLRQLRMTRL